MFENDSFKMLNTYILINFIKIKVNGEKSLELGLNMTTAAIEEGRKMMSDPFAPRYSSMDALKVALEV